MPHKKLCIAVELVQFENILSDFHTSVSEMPLYLGLKHTTYSIADTAHTQRHPILLDHGIGMALSKDTLVKML